MVFPATRCEYKAAIEEFYSIWNKDIIPIGISYNSSMWEAHFSLILVARGRRVMTTKHSNYYPMQASVFAWNQADPNQDAPYIWIWRFL